jgi:hypothetical protein
MFELQEAAVSEIQDCLVKLRVDLIPHNITSCLFGKHANPITLAEARSEQGLQNASFALKHISLSIAVPRGLCADGHHAAEEGLKSPVTNAPQKPRGTREGVYA